MYITASFQIVQKGKNSMVKLLNFYQNFTQKCIIVTKITDNFYVIKSDSNFHKLWLFDVNIASHTFEQNLNLIMNWNFVSNFQCSI